MEKSGKWLVVAIFAIALASGGLSWWFRWSATHRAAAFWGPEAARTIRDSQTITAARITNYEPTVAGPTSDQIEVSFDASQANGLVHFKQALLEDRSYAWDKPAAKDNFSPRWMLDFSPPPASSSNSHVFVLFNDACTECCYLFDGRLSRLLPCGEKFSSGLRTLFAEWFPDASN